MLQRDKDYFLLNSRFLLEFAVDTGFQDSCAHFNDQIQDVFDIRQKILEAEPYEAVHEGYLSILELAMHILSEHIYAHNSGALLPECKGLL